MDLTRLANREQTDMNDNRKLADGIELVKEDTFWPEGRWSIRRGEFVWGRVSGWKKYYEAERSETHFKTAEEAMKAWETSVH